MKRKLAIAVLVTFTFQMSAMGAFADAGGRRNPVPKPTPTQTNPPVNTGAAQQAGVADGQAPGAREGQERGAQDGRQHGLHEGFRQGLDECSKRDAQRAYDQGFAQGVPQGQAQGNNDGQVAGQQDGSRDGQAAGTTDGQNRADADANAAATPPGTQQGISDANASDASSKGQTDGAAAGDQAAQQQAKSVDYPRGQTDYSNDQFNSPVQNQDSFSQKPQQTQQPAAAAGALQAALATHGIKLNLRSLLRGRSDLQDANDGGDDGNASPDFRYYNPTKTYPTPQETTAYQQGYRQGYIAGFGSAYQQNFQTYFNSALGEGRQNGCQRAASLDYSSNAQQGFNDGRQKGYSDAFHDAHDIAYKTAYSIAFQAASQTAYQAVYQTDYQNHYNAARAAAYQQQYGQVYQASYDAAKTQKYNEVYPTYQAQEYKQGQADEAQDFQLRPVRLIDAEITGTIPSGIDEPGEALRLKLTLRNFSSQAIASKNIRLTVQASDPDGTVVSIPSEVLVHDLKPNSVTTVTDALEIRLTESAVGQGPKSFTVSAFYQERDIGDQTVEATAQFMMGTQLTAQPTLSEGLQSTIKITVTNNSQIPSEDGAIVTLNSDPTVMEILQPQQKIGVLQPGQSTVVSFPVIGQAAAGAAVNLPLGVSVNLPDGRRVGLLDTSDQVPVQNDYQISLDGSQSGLRQAGITRVGYTITNVGSRLTYKGLQLKITVTGPNASNFQVIGPDPQYLAPLDQGKSVTFFVPILSSAANSGATLQLEVQEDGRDVVIHQVAF